MQFGAVAVDPDAWKNTGTVRGIHTYANTLMLQDVPIAREDDTANTVAFEEDGVVIAKNLRVIGQLITPGFPPPGGDMALPENPNFKSVNIVGGNLTLVPGSELYVADTSYLNDVSATNLTADSLTSNEADMTDLKVDVIQERTNGNDVVINSKVRMQDLDVKKITADELDSTGKVQGNNIVAHESVVTELLAVGDTATIDDLNATSATITNTFTKALVADTATINNTLTATNYEGDVKADIIQTNVLEAKQMIQSEQDIICKDLIVNESISTKKLTASGDVNANKVTASNVDATNIVTQGLTTATLGVADITTDINTQNVHIKGDLIVDGSYPISSTPNHIFTKKITLNQDNTLGHQKTEVTFNKITLEDTNPSIFGTGGMGEVTLDAATGTMSCNGGITCHNQYSSTANPATITCDSINTLNVALDTITGHRSDFGRNVAGESIYANGQIECSHLKATNIHNNGTCTGSWDFSTATVTGLPNNGNGTSYESITEYNDHVDITKRLTVSHVGWTNGNKVNFQGDIDFANATVTGLPNNGGGGATYPSITEESTYIKLDKPLGASQHTKLELVSNEEDGDQITTTVNGTNVLVATETDVQLSVPLRTNYAGFDNAGIEFELQANQNRINFKLDDSLAYSIFQLEDATTRTIDYSTQTMLNSLLVSSIHARPPNQNITFSNNVVFEEDAEIKGHLNLGSATVSGFTLAAGNMIQFLPQVNNELNVGTKITDISVATQFCGMPNAEIQFDSEPPQAILNKVLGQNILTISDLLVDCERPLHTVSRTSSGNFTHCHLTEGDQSYPWHPGMCVTSTGEYCARDTNGNLVGDPINAPTASHGICKVRQSTKGDVILGIVASVETVTQNKIEHPHGGVTIKAPIAEADGHKMVRVAASGDVLAWVVEPTFTEIDVPPLSGLWQKCVETGNYYSQHTVISNHVGVEADGYLAVDGQVIDTNNVTVTVDAYTVTVYPGTPTYTPELFSGVYNKTINGIPQDIQVVMHCNQDYSFSFSEHFPGFEARVAALEATIAELTGPD